jgi:hypothetical protein
MYGVEKKPPKKLAQEGEKTTSPVIAERSQSESKIEGFASPIQDLLKARHLKIRAENKDLIVAVESPSLAKNEKHITLSVALRNTKNQFRAEGLIWAVAEWQDSDGKKRTEYSPEQAPGRTPDRPNANTFSIRQYKVKKFSFEVPDNSSALPKIDLWLSDRDFNKSKFEIIVGSQ